MNIFYILTFSIFIVDYVQGVNQGYRFESKIYSLLKDMNSGTRNMEVTYLLTQNGKGKFFVDIGLDMGLETITAVLSGFTVFSFEPRTESVKNILESLKSKSLSYELVTDFPEWKRRIKSGIDFSKRTSGHGNYIHL